MSSMGMQIKHAFIRKGPWKPEEDEVLINHVHLYGPRDWSSIRSKGLLQRTGKSCRLRWVNKLRPNLKNGCKFTAEEERVVIEMQAQIGNKWATIAAHLSGRTDNDVKNFWSSRQKRLARILRSQSPSSSSSSIHKTVKKSSRSSSIRCIVPVQAPKPISVVAPEQPLNKQLGSSSSSSSSYTTSTMNSSIESKPLITNMTDHNRSNSDSTNYYSTSNNFPSITLHPTQQTGGLQQQLPLFPLETQELIDRLDFSFFDSFVFTEDPPLFDDGSRFMPCSYNSSTRMGLPDGFDEFPADMFDDIEPLP